MSTEREGDVSNLVNSVHGTAVNTFTGNNETVRWVMEFAGGFVCKDISKQNKNRSKLSYLITSALFFVWLFGLAWDFPYSNT
jgi:hypothetical protein